MSQSEGQYPGPGLPGGWIDPDVEAAQPWLSAEGIVKFFEFPVRIPEMSHRAFHLYWQKHHSPNVMNVTPFAQYMRKYLSTHVWSEADTGVPARYSQAHPFEGAAEVWLNRWQEVGNWLSHPLYASLIQPDEPRFIAQDGRTIVLVTREERIFDSDPDLDENGRVKLYILLRPRTGLAREAAHAAISTHFRRLLDIADNRLLRLVVSHKLPNPNPIEGLPETDVIAVAELLFASRADMRALLAQPEYATLADAEGNFLDVNATQAVIAKVRVVHDEFSFQPSVTQPLRFDWND